MKAQAPAWLARLATPFMARHIAGAMARQHPGLTPGQIVEKMRADLGANPNPQALALVNAVERYLPQPAPSGAEERRPLSAVVLVIANLVPLYGVLFLGWDAFALILLFWLENVVIGVLNVARMLCVDPHDAALWAAKLFMVPFFCFHYGMFTAGHGAFVLSLFGGGKYGGSRGFLPLEPAAQAIEALDLGFAASVLAASHLFSFFWNFLGHGEFRRTSLRTQMVKPYARVVVLHVAIIGGGFAAAALGSPNWALLLLLALKVGLDLGAHLKEHRST